MAVDPNTTIQALQPVATGLTGFMQTISWLFGGFIGLYILTFISKTYMLWTLNKKMNLLTQQFNRLEKSLQERAPQGRKRKE